MAELMMPTEFDDDMWDGFSGAEEWDKSHPPVYVEVNGWLVIADKTGVEASQDLDTRWGLMLPFPNQKAAICYLSGLPSEFDPEYMGYTPY